MGIFSFFRKKDKPPKPLPISNYTQSSDKTVSAEPMTTSERQSYIKDKIAAQVKASRCDVIVYKSEWLGYLPYGAYHWIDCNEEDFTRDFPSDWSSDDLLVLEKTGFLEKVDYWQNPKDEYESKTTYKVNLLNNDLIDVLKDTRERLSQSEDSVWANRTCPELITMIDENIKQLEIDGTYNKNDLDLLYAPTASMQETAIDNGWGQEFLGLASRYDKAVGN